MEMGTSEPHPLNQEQLKEALQAFLAKLDRYIPADERDQDFNNESTNTGPQSMASMAATSTTGQRVLQSPLFINEPTSTIPSWSPPYPTSVPAQPSPTSSMMFKWRVDNGEESRAFKSPCSCHPKPLKQKRHWTFDCPQNPDRIPLNCPCGSSFTREDNLRRHIRDVHPELMI